MNHTPSAPLHTVFHNRRFVALWMSLLASTIGTSLVALAASIAVYREIGSALSVGLLLMTSLLPSLLIGPLAGVLVDNHSRQRIMIFAEAARFIFALLIPLLLLAGTGWLYLLLALFSIAAQFYNPAQASLLPEVTSDHELVAANAVQGPTMYGAPFVGMSLAGALAAVFPLAWVFVIGSMLFLLSLISVATVREVERAPRRPVSVGSGLKDLQEGLDFLWHTQILRILFLIFVPTYIVFGLLTGIHLPFVLNILGGDELTFGLLEGVPFVGLVAGSLIAARWAYRLSEGRWVAISLGGMSVMGMLYALANSVSAALVIGTFYMIANAPAVVARQLILQRTTTSAVRGRVNSAFFVMRDATMAVGMAAAGLGDLFGIRVVYFSGAALMLPLSLVALVWLVPGQVNARFTQRDINEQVAGD